MEDKVKAKELTRATVNPDDPEEWALYREQLLQRAEKNIKEAVEELKALGIIDEKGRRIKKELPPDMLPDSKCDL